jgi:hypothetical protein
MHVLGYLKMIAYITLDSKGITVSIIRSVKPWHRRKSEKQQSALSRYFKKISASQVNTFTVSLADF